MRERNGRLDGLLVCSPLHWGDILGIYCCFQGFRKTVEEDQSATEAEEFPGGQLETNNEIEGGRKKHTLHY